MQLLCPCPAAYPRPRVRLCVCVHAVCCAEANGGGCVVVELVPCTPQVQSLAGVKRVHQTCVSAVLSAVCACITCCMASYQQLGLHSQWCWQPLCSNVRWSVVCAAATDLCSDAGNWACAMLHTNVSAVRGYGQLCCLLCDRAVTDGIVQTCANKQIASAGRQADMTVVQDSGALPHKPPPHPCDHSLHSHHMYGTLQSVIRYSTVDCWPLQVLQA